MSDLGVIAHLEFSKREILWDWLFCNFVRNKIYVLNETRFQVGLMASKYTFLKDPFLSYSLNLSAQAHT